MWKESAHYVMQLLDRNVRWFVVCNVKLMDIIEICAIFVKVGRYVLCPSKKTHKTHMFVIGWLCNSFGNSLVVLQKKSWQVTQHCSKIVVITTGLVFGCMQQKTCNCGVKICDCKCFIEICLVHARMSIKQSRVEKFCRRNQN